MKVLVLWGVPGTGKSTFARWLKKELGYKHVDTDAIALRGRPAGEREQLWNADKEKFIADAVSGRRAIVVEYGMFADQGGIGLLRRLMELGASAWWFDGDRDAAHKAWRNENKMAARPFTEDNWDRVLRVIEAHETNLAELLGHRMLRTVEPGPTHVAPEATHRTMLEIVGAC